MQSEPTVPAISKRTARRRRRAAAVLGLGFTALAATLVPLPGTTKTAKATGGVTEDEGLACTPMSTGTTNVADPANTNNTISVKTASIVITAKGDYITEPDGNSVYMWGYAPAGGTFQIPGPVLCPEEGTLVSVTLRNDLPVDTSLVFPGQLDVKADDQSGVPGQQATNALGALAKGIAKGGSVTYSFIASHPGSYLYESGTDQGLQVQMGLAGAMIVRPSSTGAFADVKIDTTKDGQPDGRTKAYAYDDPSTAYDKSKEYLILLAETDPDVHSWVSENDGANKASLWADYPKGTDYHPRYFTINGRSFPDTIAPNHAAWLPNQPYGALAHVRPLDPTNTRVEFLPAMIHYINTQPVVDPFHPHANHETVLARDGRLLQSATVVAGQGAGQGTEQFDIPIQPGQTVDATFYWQNVDHYSSNGVTDSLYGKKYDPNPVYTAEPQIQNIIDGTYWNGTPYLGEIPANGANGKNPNKPNNNSCTGAMYNVAHSHNLAQATTYGASMGGILTLIRIDPEDNLNCQG